MTYAARCLCKGCGYLATLHSKQAVINFWITHFEGCDDGIHIDILHQIQVQDVPTILEVE